MLAKCITANQIFSENTATISNQCVNELDSFPVPTQTCQCTGYFFFLMPSPPSILTGLGKKIILNKFWNKDVFPLQRTHSSKSKKVHKNNLDFTEPPGKNKMGKAF